MNRAIAVFGASSDNMNRAYYDAARELGRLIAAEGGTLIFGAGDGGIMGACARGAHSAGGRVVGVIPQGLNEPGVAYLSCDEFIVTRDFRDRMESMEALSEAFVICPGGFGTMYELFEVLTLNQVRYIDKPIVFLNTGGYYDNLMLMFDKMYGEAVVESGMRGLYFSADTPGAALEYIDGWKHRQIDLRA